MKKTGHPQVHEINARCVCGNVISTISTSPNLDVDICSNCHPFFTGKQKLVDTGGRVDRFNKRYNLNNK